MTILSYANTDNHKTPWKRIIKVIDKSFQIFSILEIDIISIIIIWIIVPLLSTIAVSSSSFSFSQYWAFSQLPVHLQRSVHSNDNILHWKSSPHKARWQLQVMSFIRDSGAGLHSIQTISNLLSLSCQLCPIGECSSKLVFEACFQSRYW